MGGRRERGWSVIHYGECDQIIERPFICAVHESGGKPRKCRQRVELDCSKHVVLLRVKKGWRWLEVVVVDVSG